MSGNHDALVSRTAQKVLATIADDTKGMLPTERWELMSRMLLAAFQRHFQITLSAVEHSVKKPVEPVPPATPIPGETL